MTISSQSKQLIRPRTLLLVVSALILFFPKLHVIDVLPDVVAYLLLLYILAPYAVIDSHLAEAQKYLEKLALIGVAEVASIFFIYGFLSQSPQEQPMTILLCCFVLGFFKIKTVFPLTKELGDGLIYLDTRNDGTMFCSAYTRRLRTPFRKKRRIRQYSYSVTDRVMRSVRTFTVASAILNTLPELAALYYVPGDDTVFALYDYIALLRGFCMFIAFFFGVAFVRSMIGYARQIGKDTAYYARLQALYKQDELLHPERKTQQYLRRAFLLLTLFAVFTMDFSLDRINMLPDFLAAFWLLLVFWMLRRYIAHAARYALITLGYAGASVAHFVVNTAFWSHYNPESIGRNERIRVAYIPVQILSCLEGVMLLAAMVCLFFALYQIIDRYTGYEIEGSANYSREEKLKEEHRELKRTLLPAVVFGALTVISGPAYTFLRPSVEFAWMFSVVIPAIFAILLTLRCMRIQDGIDSRFMLK